MESGCLKMMNIEDMLARVQDLKEACIINGFEKPEGVDEFFQENWMQVLDILDDAIYEHLSKR